MAVDFVTSYHIERSEFIECLSIGSNQNSEAFFELSDKITLNKDFKDLNLQCFACQKQGHVAKDCKEVHVKIANIKIKWYMHRIKGKERRLLLRYNKRKFNPLKALKEVSSSAGLIIDQYLEGSPDFIEDKQENEMLVYRLNDEEVNEQTSSDENDINLYQKDKPSIDIIPEESYPSEELFGSRQKSFKMPSRQRHKTSASFRKPSNNFFETMMDKKKITAKDFYLLNDFSGRRNMEKKTMITMRIGSDGYGKQNQVQGSIYQPNQSHGGIPKKNQRLVDRVKVCERYFPKFNIKELIDIIGSKDKQPTQEAGVQEEKEQEQDMTVNESDVMMVSNSRSRSQLNFMVDEIKLDEIDSGRNYSQKSQKMSLIGKLPNAFPPSNELF